MIPIGQLYSSENSRLEAFKNNIGFGIHVCLPCVIQSYDNGKNTVEAKPLIRERVINEDGSVSYVEYPLLINVPVVMQQAGGYAISFNPKQGDECLVIFSDLSYDKWWIEGGIQNPVEQRRHDLSDGFAILGINNLKKDNPRITSGISIKNTVTGNGIEITPTNILLKTSKNSTSVDDIIRRITALEGG